MNRNLEPRTYNLIVYCDGGSRGNPGPAACAFIVFDQNNTVNSRYKCGKPALPIASRGRFLGIATNNEAEYQAVIEALNYLVSPTTLNPQSTPTEIHFFLDSSLVVNQINGLFKVKEPRLRELLLTIRKLENQISIRYPLSAIRYAYVHRVQNSAADLLVNQTLDQV